MKRFLLIGGIGSGKSTVSNLFLEQGAYCIDLDTIGQGQLSDPCVKRELVEAFGEGILNDASQIDRACLAARAFASEEATARLNAITHPSIISMLEKRLTRGEDAGSGLCIIESSAYAGPGSVDGLDEVIDGIIAVVADEDAAEGEGLGEYEALFLKEEQEAALAKYLEAYYAKEGLQDGTEHLLGVYVYDGQYLPDGSQQVLGYFTQMNFNVDGEALVEAGSAGDAMLITFTPNEDGSWEVTDFKVALEGEDYPEQVAGLAKAMGQTEEDFFGGIHDNGELSCLYEMDTYMTDHPEIKSVTFRNETFSKDELEKRISEDQSKIM